MGAVLLSVLIIGSDNRAYADTVNISSNVNLSNTYINNISKYSTLSVSSTNAVINSPIFITVHLFDGSISYPNAPINVLISPPNSNLITLTGETDSSGYLILNFKPFLVGSYTISAEDMGYYIQYNKIILLNSKPTLNVYKSNYAEVFQNTFSVTISPTIIPTQTPTISEQYVKNVNNTKGKTNSVKNNPLSNLFNVSIFGFSQCTNPSSYILISILVLYILNTLFIILYRNTNREKTIFYITLLVIFSVFFYEICIPYMFVLILNIILNVFITALFIFKK